MVIQMIANRESSFYYRFECTFAFFARTDTDMVLDEEIDLDALKTYGTPDILICGNCRLVIRDANVLSSAFFHFKNDF